MAWPGKKTHTAAIRSTLCECSSERERNVCFWSTTLFVCLSPLDCMTCVSISGIVFTTGTQFHSQNFLPRGALSLRRSVYTRIFMYVRAQVLSPSAASPHCGLSPNRVSFLFIHCGCEDPPPTTTTTSTFSLIFSLSLFSLASTALITHTPQSGPSFRAFEVILAQILLSYTADKTWKGLCLRASGSVQMCVCFFLSIESAVSPVSCVYIQVNVYTRETCKAEFECLHTLVKLSPYIPHF